MGMEFLMSGLFRTLEKFVECYEFILSVRVVLYWFPNLNPYAFPFSIVTYTAAPFLRMFSRMLPAVFGMDLSLYLGFFALEGLKQALEKCQLMF